MRRPASPSSPSFPLRGSLDTSNEAVGTNPVLRGPPQSSCHSRGVDLFVIDDSKQLNPSRNGPRPVVGVDGAHIPGSAAPGKRGRRGGRPDHRPARNELHAPADAGRPHTGRTRAEGRGTFTAPGVTLVKVTRALAGWARRARLGRRPHRRRRHARHRLPGRGRLADGRAPSPQRRIAAQRASADAEVAGSPLQGGVSGMCVRRAAVRFRQRGPSQKLGPRCRGGLCGSGVRRCCTRVRRPSGRRCGSCGSARRSAPGRPARRCPRRGRSAPRRRSARRSPPRARRRAVT